MNWVNPAFVEIKMDAEIGSYQEDQDPGRDPLFVASGTAGARPEREQGAAD
jgi:hypothetical protein